MFGSLNDEFVNTIMKSGKKSVAERIVYGAFDQIVAKTGKDPLEVFGSALGNIKPLVEVKSRRVGGATYQVPSEVRPERGTALAIRWLITFSRQKTGKPMSERLAEEILAASKKEGLSIKKREDTHKMAEANKAFAHYRW